jgi:tight adherence protein B
LAACGVYLLLTGRRGADQDPRTAAASRPTVELAVRLDGWLAQAGLADVRRGPLALATTGVTVLGAAFGWALFGAALPAIAVGGGSAGFPLASLRQRRRRRLATAQEAWPRLIEEIRILVGSAGRSIPQALFEAGGRAPVELHAAFQAAHRTWLLTTDLGPSLRVLKDRMADPTCDAACETLLVAHQLGGVDLDQRLASLAAARRLDTQSRRDARARQAGARFARRFVLAVPLGMALVGLSIGDGRAAYRSAGGQVAVLAGLAAMAGCWVWAGRLLRLPEERRVLVR